jgi:Tfp pilus assembly protein PilX
MTHTQLHRQKGAALVVGLILLVVITLLAVVGMNIANSELNAATSEQLRLRAFNAAEVGLERRLQTLRTDASTSAIPEVRANTAVEGSTTYGGGGATDWYTSTTTYRGEGNMISRYSAGTFAGFHFSVQSTGTSARSATAVNTAGAYIINSVRNSGSFQPGGAAPVTALPVIP